MIEFDLMNPISLIALFDDNFELNIGEKVSLFRDLLIIITFVTLFVLIVTAIIIWKKVKKFRDKASEKLIEIKRLN